MPDFLQQLGDALLQFANDNLYLAMAVWITVEEAGVPLPVPGDTALVIAGYQVSQGRANIFVVFAVAMASTLLGSSALYWAARRGGQPLVVKYGRFLRLTPERLARTEDRMQRYSGLTIVVGRLVPGLRIVTTVAAGVFRVNFLLFLVWTAVATLIWTAAYVFLGTFIGERIELITAFVLSNPLLVIALALLGLAILVAVRRERRNQRLDRERQAQEVL